MRDGVVEATCSGVVVREVRVTEGDPVRGCDVVGEDFEFTVRVEEVALRYAKELPKGSNGSLSANLTEEKGVDWVEVNVCAKYTLFVRGVRGRACFFRDGANLETLSARRSSVIVPLVRGRCRGALTDYASIGRG